MGHPLHLADDIAECDDGVFCNGAERCVAGECLSSGDPCSYEALRACEEASQECICSKDTLTHYDLLFVACLNLSGPAGGTSESCACLDSDTDGDLDLVDFACLQNRIGDGVASPCDQHPSDQ